MGRGAWRTLVQRVGHDRATEHAHTILSCIFSIVLSFRTYSELGH